MTILFTTQSCVTEFDEADSPEVFPKLSQYNIFHGFPGDLIPNADYTLYELSSSLFTDQAEKQRLIKVPIGAKIKVEGDGLATFPEGTILVKTFFYYHDKRASGNGVRIIETRILEKREGKWAFGTYIWNDAQTDATLVTSGYDTTVNWIDDQGNGQVISYRIPSNFECRSCHNDNDTMIPIGLKGRNLNTGVLRNGVKVNQLDHLFMADVIDPVNPEEIGTLPNYNDVSVPLESRARAYLEMNCAHCHNESGMAAGRRLFLSFDTSFESTNIVSHKEKIWSEMESGEMPKIGTTIIDAEGVVLIKQYLETL
jgi:uncharacterized repeat protein (TIGR03806 family)